MSDDLPPDPFEPELSGIEGLPVELQEFARSVIRAGEDVRALYDQSDGVALLLATQALEKRHLRAIIVAAVIELRRCVDPEWRSWMSGRA